MLSRLAEKLYSLTASVSIVTRILHSHDMGDGTLERLTLRADCRYLCAMSNSDPPHSEPESASQPDESTADDTATAPDTAKSKRFRVFSTRFSGPGLLVALLFFALSLFESLLPRTGLFQGVVSGITIAIGYGLGTLGQWLWIYLEIPKLKGKARLISGRIIVGALGIFVILSTWLHVGWQNELRELFGMDPVSPMVWLTIVAVAIPVAALLLIIARSLGRLFFLFSGWLDKVLPYKLSRLLGAVALGFVVWLGFTGVIENGFFAAANQIFAPRDTRTDEGVTQPESALKSGSPDSASKWDSLGRKGRSFVATGPTVDDINAYSGGGAVEPIRAYVGLKASSTIDGRAEVALQELIRTGAFDREILVVATTTGTGFLDAHAVDPLEYMYNGDTAIVGVQYSYLPSWISLLADKDVTRETSRVVFDEIHSYWATLPEESRPKLFIYGLSLGSFGVESILTSINLLNEPLDGAFMAGPPFVNDLHKELTDNRDPGSPASLPVFQDGRTVRFTGEVDSLDEPTATWDDTRVAYLQHASDPVVFFSWDLAFEEPDWLKDGQRGPDVSDTFIWIPIVTLWQVALDLPAAGSVPEGFGHLYTVGANAAGWAGVTQPEGWTSDDTANLSDFLSGIDKYSSE
jgi:uncharacterized membrane protein